MKAYHRKGITLDPHTAVGIAAAEESGLKNVIALATAHPAKFGGAVKQATGELPHFPYPLKGIMEQKTRCLIVQNDRQSIKKIIESAVSKQKG
jgi:threonine synthase